MIVFKTVKIQNFLSYGNSEAEINLQRSNPTLISGTNYDASSNGEFDSNGSGKSSILMAIAFALYDKPLCIENPKKNDLINNINKKDMLVTVELETKQKKYSIYRFRKNKAMGGDGVRIEEDGKDITPDSTANANKFIAEHILGIPYEIFGKIVVYAAGTDSFLKMNLATQRNIVEELFSYSELSRKAELLKEKIKNNKNDLEYAKKSNQDIKEEAERHKKQVREAEHDYSEWNDERKKKLTETQEIIDSFSDINFDDELKKIEDNETIKKEYDDLRNSLSNISKEIQNYKDVTEKFNTFEQEKIKTIEQLEKQLDDLDITDKEIEDNKEKLAQLEEKKQKLNDLSSSIKNNESKLSTIRSRVKELTKEKAQLEDSTCPYCHQTYEEAASKLKEVSTELTEKESEQTTLENTLENENTKEIKINDDITELKKGLIFDSIEQIERFISKKDKLESDLKWHNESSNPHEDKSEDIKRLEKEKSKIEKKMDGLTVDDDVLFKDASELYKTQGKLEQAVERLNYIKEEKNPYEKVIQSLKDYEPKESKDQEIDDLIDEIKHQEFLLKLLTKKDSFVRKALMDKYLPFLNDRLKFYLNTMGLPHKVRFKSDLSTEISQFDKEISYANLSSGQKARIDIALSLAFRDVLQSKHNFINLFILDECLDVGLSNVGIKKTLTLIKEVAKSNKLSMFVISHRDEIKSAFKDRLEIELRNGFSSVKKPS